MRLTAYVTAAFPGFLSKMSKLTVKHSEDAVILLCSDTSGVISLPLILIVVLRAVLMRWCPQPSGRPRVAVAGKKTPLAKKC